MLNYLLLHCRSQENSIPCENVIPSVREKPLIAITFSRLPAAMSRVGMPLFVPRPSSCRDSMPRMTTAGDTAECTNLKIIIRDDFSCYSNFQGRD